MTPIALVVLAAGAVSYAYLVDGRSVSDADRATRRRDVFPRFRVDEVQRVELEHGPDELVLERNADAGRQASTSWTMTSRRHETADSSAVDMLLREMEFATRVRQVPEGSNLAQVALAMPRVRGRVQVGALEYRFALGGDAPRPDGAAYMSIDGEGTFVIERSLKAQLLRGEEAYRDRMVVGLQPNQMARIEVHSPDGRDFALERTGVSLHVGGSKLRASRSASDHLVASLVDARADSFLDHAAAARTTTALRVSVWPSEGAQVHELRIGGPCPGQPDDVVLLRTSPSPMEVCTAKTLLDALSRTSDSLVDDSALWARADEIEQIRLETIGNSGPVVEIARKANGWHERAPQDRDLGAEESDSANSLAAALAGARSVEAPRASDGERLIPRVRATVVRDRGGSTEVIDLASPATDGTVLARRSEDGALLRFSREVARHFEPRPIVLRPLAIWQPAFDPGAVVAIDDACTSVPMHLELREGTWVMRSPPGFAADPLSASDLMQAIAHAKAEAWVSESDEEGFGFDRPSACSVTLTLAAAAGESKARRVGIIFGLAAEGGVYARTPEGPAVFIAPKSLRDLASYPAVDRSALRLDPETLDGVTVVRGGARLRLERKGERLLRQSSDFGDGGDNDKIEKALEDLFPRAVVHTGPPLPDEQMQHPTLEINARAVIPDGGVHQKRELHITVGAPSRVEGAEVYFARASGVDATFAIPRRAVNAILDAW
jgi:hypothetical protein